jgi:hypothetical protein
MSVVPKLSITAVRKTAEVGLPYLLSPNATGGKPAYKWTIEGGTLPTGLQIDANSGAISGTPTTAGAGTVTLAVTDSLGLKVTVNVNVTVVPRLLLTKQALPAAKAGSRYGAVIAKTGGARPYTWRATGLPAGVKLLAGGRLSGTPTKAGTYRIKVQVRDGLGAVSSRTYLLKVSG